MNFNFGLSYSEVNAVHTINPEIAAHNIALAYVASSANPQKLLNGEEILPPDVLSLSSQYAEAYNYAYNFITHHNKFIKEAE